MGFRVWLSAAALLLGVSAQPLGVLRIKVTVVDADGRTRAVPRHVLLISENPSTAAPTPATTTLDGVAEVRLKPGNYTIESDQPLVLGGKAYEWRQTLDVPAGQTTSLELTAANAMIEAAPSGSSSSGGAPGAGNASALLIEWQHSVVSIWSPTKLGSGFLIDARGLIATNQRLIGPATTVEVQLSATDKVAASVLAKDPDKNVAILWVDPKAVAAARPMKLGYADGGVPPAEKDKLFTINAPVHDQKSLMSGTVSKVNVHSVVSDLRMDEDSLGAPLFNAAGEVVAITTPDDDAFGGNSRTSRAVRIDDARSVIAAAEKKMQTSAPPSAARLPVESQRSFDDEVLKAATKRRAGSFAPYRVAAADFDVSVITPLLLYGARHRWDEANARGRGNSGSAGRDPGVPVASMRALEAFANWEYYVRDDPPVLMIRATPKFVESFWTTIARGAAQTQGVSLPAIKHLKAGFFGMRLTCGAADVPPVHPFKIEQRVSQNEALYEGLYIFEPDAIGPQCGTVKLTLFSDKDGDKGDTRVVDPKILEQIRQDFALYRAAASGAPRLQ